MDRAEEDFLVEAGARIEAVFDRAGLTLDEREVWWRRIGYDQSWREISRDLGLVADGRPHMEMARRLWMRGRRRLAAQVAVEQVMDSPLHPDYSRYVTHVSLDHGVERRVVVARPRRVRARRVIRPWWWRSA